MSENEQEQELKKEITELIDSINSNFLLNKILTFITVLKKTSRT